MHSVVYITMDGAAIWDHLYLLSESNFPVTRGKDSTSLEQMTHLHMRIPVLIFERVKTGEYLRIFKRYRRKLVFLGKMNVLGILLMGLSGYWYLTNTRYDSAIHEGLTSILSRAGLDNESFKVVDWFQKSGRLSVLITREFARRSPNSSPHL